MREWENQMGTLESAAEMSKSDYLVSTNIVDFDSDSDTANLTKHIDEILVLLRQVSFSIS